MPGRRWPNGRTRKAGSILDGAVGSAAGSQAYAHGGWAAASATAAVFPVLGLGAWLADRRHEQARSGQHSQASRPAVSPT